MFKKFKIEVMLYGCLSEWLFANAFFLIFCFIYIFFFVIKHSLFELLVPKDSLSAFK